MDSSSLDSDDLKVYQDSLNNMVTVYNTEKIVSRDGSSLYSLEPEVYEAIADAAQQADVEAYEEQLYYWYNWHSKVGHKCKADYETFVEVSVSMLTVFSTLCNKRFQGQQQSSRAK